MNQGNSPHMTRPNLSSYGPSTVEASPLSLGPAYASARVRSPGHNTTVRPNRTIDDDRKSGVSPTKEKKEEYSRPTNENATVSLHSRFSSHRSDSEGSNDARTWQEKPRLAVISPSNESKGQMVVIGYRRALDSRILDLARRQLITDIQRYLDDSTVRRRFTTTLSTEAMAYLSDPQYYNATRNASRNRFSHHLSVYPEISRLSLPRHLRAIDEYPGSKLPSVHAKSEVDLFNDAAARSDVDTDDDMDIPKPEWGRLRKYFEFMYYCIHDTFENNPYKVYPLVYVGLFSCLMWSVLARSFLAVVNLRDMMKRPWDADLDKDARRDMDSYLTILPVIVQMVLFLFPPLLANPTL